MAGDDSRAPSPLLVALRLTLDAARPSGTLEWVSAAVPAVTRAATGAGHWAAGRRQRALAEWAGAAGSGLITWGLGTEAPQGSDAARLPAPPQHHRRAGQGQHRPPSLRP